MKALIALFPLVLVGCGAQDQAAETNLSPSDTEIPSVQPSPEVQLNPEVAMLVEATSDLPSCEANKEGKLAYAKVEKTFYVCTELSWVQVDLKGPAGTSGVKGDKGDKGDTGAAGPQGDKGDKGDKGDTGATGATGSTGAKGDTGNAGSNGTNGTDNKITKQIVCEAASSANLYIDNGLSLYYRYSVSVLSSGDVYAQASIYGGTYDEGGAVTVYAGTHASNATAPVSFTYDVLSTKNNGKWTISLNRTTLETTITYVDSDVTGGTQTWTKTAAACTQTTY